MKKAVWRYDLVPFETIELEIPFRANALRVGSVRRIGSDDCPSIWLLVDPNAEKTKRSFISVPTGETIEYNDEYRYQYIGTYLTGARMLVFHVFEIFRR